MHFALNGTEEDIAVRKMKIIRVIEQIIGRAVEEHGYVTYFRELGAHAKSLLLLKRYCYKRFGLQQLRASQLARADQNRTLDTLARLGILEVGYRALSLIRT